ncbi:MAG: Aliphatic amidase AmiE (EC 3.5.1.4) [Olavius algarvensis Delta 4 endosymbiont]|nr:MAG: Aliphatic amidase AmiE (EC 3.5.1.4) [Olavius algarvensis Delta 4 endosymbiont]
MSDLTVTIVQSELAWEDPAANLKRFDQSLANLGGKTDLVILPEMFSTGFSMQPAPVAQTMDSATVRWLQSTAAALEAHLMGSVMIVEDGRYYNRFMSAGPDGKLQTCDKRHLFRMLGEDNIYTGGQRLLTVTIKGWKLRPFICYDLRFPAWSRNLNNDYDVAVYVANWPAKRAEHWKALLKARAIENLCYVIGVNRVGADGNGLEYCGDSAVIDPVGNTLFTIHNEPAVRTVTLSREILEIWRRDFPVWLDADHDVLDLPDPIA